MFFIVWGSTVIIHVFVFFVNDFSFFTVFPFGVVVMVQVCFFVGMFCLLFLRFYCLGVVGNGPCLIFCFYASSSNFTFLLFGGRG